MVEWLRQLGLYQLISRFAIIYALYAPIQATYKESQSLKGLATERREDNVETVENRIRFLQSEYGSIGKEQTKTATELAYAEVISYNRKNLERELQNES